MIIIINPFLYSNIEYPGIEVHTMLVRDNKETELFARINHDPGFQVNTRLRKRVRILPGDKIVTICVFNTTLAAHEIGVNIYNLYKFQRLQLKEVPPKGLSYVIQCI